MNNRLGRFTIQKETVDALVNERQDEAVARWGAVFGKVVVIEAAVRYDLRAVEYLAYCNDFEALPPGHMAPIYDVEITQRTDILAGQPLQTFEATFRKR